MTRKRGGESEKSVSCVVAFQFIYIYKIYEIVNDYTSNNLLPTVDANHCCV